MGAGIFNINGGGGLVVNATLTTIVAPFALSKGDVFYKVNGTYCNTFPAFASISAVDFFIANSDASSGTNVTVYKKNALTIDGDVTAFVASAGITNPGYQSAINQLCTRLKATSIWPKLKAIYPIIGGNDTSHSYNLKDVSQYRLLFQPAVAHSSTGIVVNSTYATMQGLTPLFATASTGFSMHLYVRSNPANVTMDINSVVGSLRVITHLNYGGTMYFDLGNDSVGRLSIASATDKIGLLSFNALSPQQTISYRGQNIAIKTLTFPSSLPNSAFKLGGDANTREYAFIAIGDGLNSFELTSMYEIVQEFQTTLGRAV